ncbi:hypothetical protein WR25_04812 isoform A [Diploscapter pachys]|uniref:PHD-type domain-containing protein n=1 Tax=Diploscapter pachys TaxID=2018661 RepID=A0A2A2LMX1_9BILA|nr:hypothetical protein WR25_04812 isoform A [Diploscapter pachys]
MMCIECGGAVKGSAEVCDSCNGVGPDSSSSVSMMTVGPSMSCSMCGLLVDMRHTQARMCTTCNKYVHTSCDSSEGGLDGFTCAMCRRSPLVQDVMLSGMSNPSPGHEEQNTNTTSGVSSSMAGSSDMAPPTSYHSNNSPPLPSGGVTSGVGAEFTDVYNLSEGIASPATTSDSARNSPFYPENSSSDIDEDFVPASVRGGYRGRGAKKKPGVRGSSTSKRGAGKPPNIFTGEKSGTIPGTTRGKRGGRGSRGGSQQANKGVGRGRGRGRSSASSYASAIIQGQQNAKMLLNEFFQNNAYHNQFQNTVQSNVREVDEAMIVDEEERHAKSEDAEYVRTVVLCEQDDEFLQKACLCLVCGSVGKGPESSMVACSNCAQTYHTYCVGLHDKLNNAVVCRGWRCLDCTVCEGCGKGEDESKLLLCEECDISYHIYCLTPRLERIPQGPWRCQWCARCRRCNVRVASGLDLTKDGLCLACHSMRKCPKCVRAYNVGDKIIRCSSCLKWYHGTCEDLYNDEMLEQAAQGRMRCTACRPSTKNFANFMPFGADSHNVVVCDNVALNKAAEEVLGSKFMPSVIRPNPLESMYGGYHRSDSFDHFGSIDEEYQPEEFEPIISSSGRGRGSGRGGGPGRRLTKIGVGGFVVKQARNRLVQNEDEVSSSSASVGGNSNSNGPTQGPEDEGKKQRKPRKPRKSFLEDAYPAIIQENFFGMKAVEGKNLIEVTLDEPHLMEQSSGRNGHADGHNGHELSYEATEMLRNDMTENDILESMDLRDLDMDVNTMDFSMLMEDEEDEAFDDSLYLNDAIDLVRSDANFGNTNQQPPSSNQGPSTSQQHPAGPMQSQQGMHPGQANLNQHHHDFQNGPHQMHPNQHQMPHMVQQQQQKPSMYGQPGMDMQPQMGQDNAGMPGQNMPPALVRTSSDQGLDANNDKSNSARWLEDEPLGLGATIAAVLYVNSEHSYLKEQYPEINERIKQMHKLWRQLDAERRQHYVLRARQNRTDRGCRRARRVGSTARVSSQSSSVDSPTVSSPTGNIFSQQPQPGRPQMMSPVDGLPERFKVPPIPPGGMPPMPQGYYVQPPQQKMESNGVRMQSLLEQSQLQRTLSHLPEEMTEQYRLMGEKTQDLLKRQEGVESDLARLRKQKKTLAAKKRQMQKQQAAAVAAAGGPEISVGMNGPEGTMMGQVGQMNQNPMTQAGQTSEPLPTPPAADFDLSDEEKQCLTQLQTQISARQKDLENVKRELKNHQGIMFEFESKYHITRPMVGGNGVPIGAGTDALHQPGSTPVGIALRGAISGNASGLMGAQMGGPGGIGPPPYGSLMHPPANLMQQGAQPMRVPQQMPYGSIMNNLESQRRIAAIHQGAPPGAFSGALPPHQHSRMPWGMMLKPYSMSLGGIPYERLTSPVEKEIYECLDDVIHKITIDFDGRDPAREMIPPYHPMQSQPAGSGMLKRLLDPGLGPMQLPPHMMSSSLADPLEPPKPKKKRQMQKKPGPSALENQYDIMVERVNAQLKNCERLPKRAQEPSPRNPGAVFAVMGISDLTNRAEKRALLGDTIGQMQLSFMDDYFGGEERKVGSKWLFCPPPSMAEVSPDTNLVRLTQIEMPQEQEIFTDKEDAIWQPYDVLASFSDYIERCEKSEHIRVRCRITECPPPPEPHRRAFYQKIEQPDEVEVSLLVQENEERSLPETIEDLKRILDVGEMDYQLDTPPLSPLESKNHNDYGTATDRIESEQQVKLTAIVKEEPLNPSTSDADACRTCHRAITKPVIVQKASAMGIRLHDDSRDDATVQFCSGKCYYVMMAQNKVILSADQLAAAEGQADEETMGRLKQIHAENLAKCINQGKSRMDLPLTPIFSDALLTSPRDSRYGLDDGKRDLVKTIRVCELSQLQGEQQRRTGSRAAGEEWKVYSKEILASFLRINTIKKELALSAKLGVALPSPSITDRRRCVLCGQSGDGETSICGRLLNYEIYWVYENPQGGLEHVETAIVRSLTTSCEFCRRFGATLKCYKVGCETNFHIPCAKAMAGAKFIKDRTFICPKHTDVNPEVVVTNLETLRRVYIVKNENALLAKLFEINDDMHKNKFVLKLGALTFHQIGQLLPEQLKTFHNATYLFPVGYTVARWFWSPNDAKVRVQFTCKIQDGNGRPKFVVSMGDEKTWEGESASEAWQSILKSVEKKRTDVSDALHFFPQAIQGETLLGLNEAAISKITESLPGVDTLYTYTFRHSNSPILDLPLAENPSGCARAGIFLKTILPFKIFFHILFISSKCLKRIFPLYIINFISEEMG